MEGVELTFEISHSTAGTVLPPSVDSKDAVDSKDVVIAVMAHSQIVNGWIGGSLAGF